MADLSIYFQPVVFDATGVHKKAWCHDIEVYTEVSGFPAYEEAQVALIGVKEDRGSTDNSGAANGVDEIRSEFYRLFKTQKTKLVDLGNINPGETLADTHYALSNTVSELVKKNVIPIIVGGSQDLTYANYLGYEQLEQVVNLTCIDQQFDVGSGEKDVHAHSYLSKIVLHQPNFLFNFSNIGYQTYLVNPEELELMSKLFFDVYRVGEMQRDIRLTEPVIRNADIVSFDLSAARVAEFPGTGKSGPNGFYGDEMCQMAWYAGISDKVSSVGFYEFNPAFDVRDMSAKLAAQMIWCFIDGVANRKGDFPVSNKKRYKKYIVTIEGEDHALIFYKSPKSDRWWMDVPYPPNKHLQFERHHFVPCSYEDYERAVSQEMPDKWWKTYQKLV